jgi:hypothetical protein
MTTIVTRTDTLASANASTTVKGSALTHTELDRNFYPINISTNGTAEASKALVLDSNKDFTGVRHGTFTGTVTGGSITDGTATLSGGSLTGVDIITAIGGQSGAWTDVKASRALGTVYQNTTGYQIMVNVTVKIQESVNHYAYCDAIDGLTLVVSEFESISSNANVDNFRFTHSFIVPDDSYYSFTAGSAVLVNWVELR